MPRITVESVTKASRPLSSLTATLAYDLFTSPSKLGEDGIKNEVESAVRMFSASLPESSQTGETQSLQNKAVVEKFGADYYEALKRGRKTASKVRLSMSAGSIAAVFESPDGSSPVTAIWKDSFYYSLRGQALTIEKRESIDSTELGALLNTISNFGRISSGRYLASDVKFTEMDGGKIVMDDSSDFAARTSTLAPIGGGLLESVSWKAKEIPSWGSWSFSEYTLYNGSLFPRCITCAISSDKQDSRHEIRIEALNLGISEQHDFDLSGFGFIQVFDRRFKDGLMYFTYDRLPSDEQLISWVENPLLLDQHNRQLVSKRR